jgi:signal transduction histidine kinase
VAEAAPKVSFKANTVVFRQGDRSTTMYLILKGSVKIERADPDGESISVGQLSGHHIFGELAMLSEEPRQATVTAITDSDFLVIDREMMLEIIRKSNAQEILDVFSVLSAQTRAANDREFQQVLSRNTISAQMEAEKQRALTQMVAGVAHEINTPLGIINTAVSIMARELAVPTEITTQRAADIAESLELIRRNVERADQLVQDFKKVSISQLTAEKEALDISEVVEETIGLMMVSLKRNKISVKFHDRLKLDQKKWVGYRGFLSQILINFLSNIERYAYPNDVGGVVTIDLEILEDDHYRITVSDNGRGISEENLPHIFEPFFTTGRSIGGTGLGLAIVHNLATNALKGRIDVSSNADEGTDFILTFPKVVPD